MLTQALAAVFFDLDGTLIESETIWNDAVLALAAGRGSTVPPEVLAATQGMSSLEAMVLVHQRMAWPDGDVAADVAWVEEQVRDIYLERIVWRPGALDLVRRVRAAGIPTGLVTSTYSPLVRLVLDDVGGDDFDVVVCGDDVRAPKPDPEPYLAAAARLGVPAGRCVAIEDSAPGAASARAAGCLVVIVGGSNDTLGDLVVESLVDVDVDTLSALVQR